MIKIVMLKPFILFLLASFISIPLIKATPAQILIIRHAEKPSQGDSLSTVGRERAAALAPYFMETKELLSYGKPVAIYATGTSKASPSLCSIETVQPLAKALSLTVISLYERDDYLHLIKEIMNEPSYHGKTVLICWEQTFIPEMARAFKALQSPNKWPHETFDRIWMINISSTGKTTFKNMPQRLLFGDASN